MKTIKIIFLGCLAGFFALSLNAQQILLDKPIRAGQLVLFPELQNSGSYYYLPDKVEIAKTAQGTPQFSFIKYVRNTDVEGGASTISESDEGGGIVHAVVSLNVPAEMLQEAKQALRRYDSNGEIVGPVVYKSGTIALISSIANDEGGLSRKVVGIGTAPIIDGQKAAVSVQLTKQGADILWATFQTETPDLSFSFEMEVQGYLSPKRVLIEADFERMYSNETFEAAARTPVLAAEINLAFDELHDSGAIKVTQIGEDEQLDKLLETAYSKLTNLMFDKIGGSGVPELNQMLPNNEKSMLDRAGDMLTQARKEAREENQRLDEMRARQQAHEREVRGRAQTRRDSILEASGRPVPDRDEEDNENEDQQAQAQDIPENEAIPSLAVAVSYRMKQVRRTGSYKLDLNKYTTDTRTMRFDENVGNLLNCETCLQRINLDDPLYKQRTIHARIDGMNSQDFGTYINSVTVVMKKQHQDGSSTVRELQINKSKFNESGNDYTMQYGWKGDDNREDWLTFEYKTQWNFFGGHTIETDWESTDFGSIALSPPLVKKPIYIEADPGFMQDEEVRAVEVKLYYSPTNKEDVRRINLKTGQEELSHIEEIILPKGVEDYQYEMTWFVKGKPPVKIGRTSSQYGMLYLDSLPN